MLMPIRPRRLARLILNRAARSLSFDTAVLISKQLLMARGFGAGGHLRESGEFGVFRLLQGPVPTLFDVGGHLGEYSLAFLDAFPNGKAMVFEPSAPHLVELRKNVASRAGVTVFPVALGAENAQMPLYKDAEITGLASLHQRRLDFVNIKLEAAESVSVTTLDAIVEENGVTSIDLLKMDVEGHEFAVLQGAQKAMQGGIIKLVQFEFGGCNLDTHTTLQDFFYFFKAYGFGVGLIQPRGTVKILDRYDEFYELYRTANFVAGPRQTLARNQS